MKNCFIHTQRKLAPIDFMLEHYPGKISSVLFNKK